MRVAPLVLLAGCSRVFGLSHVDPPPADAPADVAMRTVTCDYLWHVVPTAGEVQTMAAPSGYAHVSYNGQELAVGGDGSFTFDAPANQPWELVFTSPGNSVHLIRNSDSCHLVTTFSHRLGGAPPTTATPVSITTTTPAPPSGLVRFAGTGIRAVVQVPAPTSSTYTTDWHALKDLAGEPAALLNAAAGDRLYWTHFAMTSQYYRLDQAAVTAMTMTNGQGNAATITPVTLPPSCTHVVTNAGMLVSALAAADPRGAGTPASFWTIDSSPAPSEGFNEGIPLAFPVGSNPVDEDLMVPYANPFSAETDMVAFTAANEHMLAIGAATPTLVLSAFNAFLLPQPDSTGACNSTTAVPVPPVAMATTTTVAGQSLTGDEQPVTLDRSAPVPVTIGLTSGPWDELIVAIFEVSAQNGATTLTGIAEYQPLDTSFGIDPSLLLVGHEYMLILYARVGVPLSRQADFRTYQYPFAQSTVATFSFRIAN